MTDKRVDTQKPFNPWHFIWITVVASELFTAFLNVLQYKLYARTDLPQLLTVGAVDSLFVPLIVAPVIIYFIRKGTELQKHNEQLQQEIMDRQHAEAALQESEKRFRTLLQNVPSVAVQGYGRDGTTQYWNHASENLYGYTEKEAIGRNLLDLIIPPEMRNDVQQAIHMMAETGEPIPPSELSLMRKDGSRVEVYSSHSIVKRTGGEPELFCLDVDLSERKHVEKEREGLIAKVQKALAEIRTLQGILPICSSCKKIRDNNGSWTQIEEYISEHSEANFSHSYCPECAHKAIEEVEDLMKEQRKE